MKSKKKVFVKTSKITVKDNMGQNVLYFHQKICLDEKKKLLLCFFFSSNSSKREKD